MRKLLLSTLFISMVLFTMAQTFTLTPKVVVKGASSSETIDLYSAMKNNATTDADSMFQWTIIKRQMPAAWERTFCDPNNCIPSDSIGMSGSFLVKKGMNGEFKLTYNFHNTGGLDTTKIQIKSVLNPSVKDTVTFIMNAWLTGVNNVSRENVFSFYPNPVKDVLTFKYNTNSTVNVDIYNILGVKVKSFTHDGNSSRINVSELRNGIYFITLKEGNYTYSKSFTKSE